MDKYLYRDFSKNIKFSFVSLIFYTSVSFSAPFVASFDASAEGWFLNTLNNGVPIVSPMSYSGGGTTGNLGCAITATGTYTFSQNDINAGVAITNTATGTPVAGTLVDPTVDESVTVVATTAGLTLLKTGVLIGTGAVGGLILTPRNNTVIQDYKKVLY